MLGFHEYHKLSQSSHAEERGRAARIAARAYIEHDGPEDEQAALYAAVLSFLDDSSVKVRAALAYELLHSANAPRPVIFALAQDQPIISAAIAQYSPVLLDSDLIALIEQDEPSVTCAILGRNVIGSLVCNHIFEMNRCEYDLLLLQRNDAHLDADMLIRLSDRWRADAKMRGVLLERNDLPSSARLVLVETVMDDLRSMRLVKGSIRPGQLQRLARDVLDCAATGLVFGVPEPEHVDYVTALFHSSRLTPRLLISALANGRSLFFATSVSILAELGIEKVIGQLETGTRRALHALFRRCGFTDGLCNLMCCLCTMAREHNLQTDVAARHFVISRMIGILIDRFNGQLPEELEDVFTYLNEQNVALARASARGVMASFVAESGEEKTLLSTPLRGERLALAAA